MLNEDARHQLHRQLDGRAPPNAITDDPVAVSDLADELMKAAERKASRPTRSTKKSTASS
jgi:hypothetical protein